MIKERGNSILKKNTLVLIGTVKDWGVLQFYLSFNYCSLLSQRPSRQTTANSQLNRSELFFKTSEHNNVSEISPKWL